MQRNVAQIRGIVQQLKGITDPNQLKMKILQRNNPALAKALKYVSENGGNLEVACKKIMQENGVNFDEVFK